MIDNSLLIEQLGYISKVAYFTARKTGFALDAEDVSSDIACMLLSRYKATTAKSIKGDVKFYAKEILRKCARRYDAVKFCELDETTAVVSQDQTAVEVIEFMNTLERQEKECALLLLAGVGEREYRNSGKRIDYARRKVKDKLTLSMN